MLAHMPSFNNVMVVKMNGRFPLILKISAAAIGIGLLFWLRQPIGDILRIISDRQAVALYLDQFGVLASLLLAVIMVLQVIVAAIPGHALMVGGSYVYGFWPAFCLSLTTTVVGSQIAFWLARRAGRPLIEKLAPVDLLNKWYDVSAEKGLLFFLFAFMLPIFPADIMNYIAGLSSLSPRRFFVANLLGRLPGVVMLTAVGAYGFQLSLNAWIGIAVAGVVMLGAWRLFFSQKSREITG
ncbi:MAG: TVP38/TMEM64 family protein [Chloroflexi bacterium]|nr:TVP38/TMEM64 family protein [Chloroflexota bacterium]MBP7590176.1 TVP38/TMEM64 family protein [Chloroflexota bacterium]